MSIKGDNANEQQQEPQVLPPPAEIEADQDEDSNQDYELDKIKIKKSTDRIDRNTNKTKTKSGYNQPGQPKVIIKPGEGTKPTIKSMQEQNVVIRKKPFGNSSVFLPASSSFRNNQQQNYSTLSKRAYQGANNNTNAHQPLLNYQENTERKFPINSQAQQRINENDQQIVLEAVQRARLRSINYNKTTLSINKDLMSRTIAQSKDSTDIQMKIEKFNPYIQELNTARNTSAYSSKPYDPVNNSHGASSKGLKSAFGSTDKHRNKRFFSSKMGMNSINLKRQYFENGDAQKKQQIIQKKNKQLLIPVNKSGPPKFALPRNINIEQIDAEVSGHDRSKYPTKEHLKSKVQNVQKQTLQDINYIGQPKSVMSATTSFMNKVYHKLERKRSNKSMSQRNLNEFFQLPSKQDLPGPGQYELPALVAREQEHSISSIRNSPRVFIGLPNEKNSPYFRETITQFAGRSSPAPSRYQPVTILQKERAPGYSISKFKRFYQPSSVTILRQNVPNQYQEADNMGKKNLDQSLNDLMGTGKRFEYKLDKKDETTPGPGMYSNTSLDTIQKSLIRSKNKSSLTKDAGFGATREQNDKLQLFGQERHFLGRHGEPGQYNLPDLSITKSKKITIPKTERGLLQASFQKQELQRKLYNNSHQNLSPASYNVYA